MMLVLHIVRLRGNGDDEATMWCGEESLPLDIFFLFFLIEFK